MASSRQSIRERWPKLSKNAGTSTAGKQSKRKNYDIPKNGEKKK